MKKYLFLIPSLVLIFSCSGENKQKEKSPEELQEQIEIMENSTQKLDESLKSSDSVITILESDVDSLLTNI